MKVMIVEDEEVLLNGLAKMIRRIDPRFQIAATASNGLDALRQLESAGPELIITDIRMPGMDGIELLREVRNRRPDVQTVILSGYNDFEYARQGIQVGCAEYLLKPPDFKELSRLLTEISNKVEANRKREKEMGRKSALIRQNRQTLRRQFLNRLISGGEPFTDRANHTWLEEAKSLDILIQPNQKYRLLMIRFAQSDGKRETYSHRDQKLIEFAALNIVEETTGYCPCFYDDYGHLIVLHPAEEERSSKALCKQIQHLLLQYVKLFASIGFSTSHDISMMPAAYREARMALMYHLVAGPGVLTSYTQLLMNGDPDFQTFVDQLSALESSGNLRVTIDRLDDWYNQLVKTELPVKDIEPLLSRIKLSFLNLADRWLNSADFAVQGGKAAVLRQIDEADSVYTMYRSLQLALRSMDDGGGKIENRAVAQAIKYMNENYRQDVSLPSISGEVYMNPAYFSVLFKKTTGKSVVEYLTDIRMVKAKELLKQLDLKTYQVAEAVGYDNAAYFSTLFKKHTGMTPQEYRNTIV